MSPHAFKVKSDKEYTFENKISFNSSHKAFIEQQKEEKNKLPIYQEELSKLAKTRDGIAKQIERKQITLIDNDQLNTKLYDIETKILNMEKKIEKIKNNTDNKNYYFGLVNACYKYYGTKDTITKPSKYNANLDANHDVNCKTSENFETDIDCNINSSYETGASYEIDGHIDNSANYKKSTGKDFLSMYLQKINDLIDNSNNNSYYQGSIVQKEDNGQEKCVYCGSINFFDICDGRLVCRNCGIHGNMVTELMKPSHKEKSSEKPYPYSYKKLNHFDEWINLIQGKEVTKIPPEVFSKLLGEVKKERIVNTKNITQKKVRNYLHKLGLNIYYEHVPYITEQLGGEKPPKIPSEIVSILRNMFIEISAEFVRYCPKNRKNFPRYTYIIYKCCELIDYREILQYLPLLKTRQRLIEMDVIWKNICAMRGYRFINTV